MQSAPAQAPANSHGGTPAPANSGPIPFSVESLVETEGEQTRTLSATIRNAIEAAQAALKNSNLKEALHYTEIAVSLVEQIGPQCERIAFMPGIFAKRLSSLAQEFVDFAALSELTEEECGAVLDIIERMKALGADEIGRAPKERFPAFNYFRRVLQNLFASPEVV